MDGIMSSIMSMDLLLVGLINQMVIKERERDIWANSKFKYIKTLESNNVGVIGEQFIQGICNAGGIDAQIDGATTRETGGGAGDGKIKGRTVEIKCARLGTGKTSSFQHELGEKPWIADYLCFVDISPNKIYVTIFPNMTEEQYKMVGFRCPYFPSKGITWRKSEEGEDGMRYGGGAFKLDTTLKLNEKQGKIDNPYTFIWSSPEDDEKISAFIDRIVKTKETSLETAMTGLTI